MNTNDKKLLMLRALDIVSVVLVGIDCEDISACHDCLFRTDSGECISVILRDMYFNAKRR